MKGDNFKLAIDLYSKDKPFQKVIIDSSIGGVGLFSASIITIGFSDRSLFYVSAILGKGYIIYKIVKTKKLKIYKNEMKEESSIEEREILSRLTQQCLYYFRTVCYRL